MSVHIPSQRTSTRTGPRGTSTVVEEASPSVTMRPAGGSPQVILVLGILMMIMLNWDSTIVPITGLVWKGQPVHLPDARNLLGEGIFLALLVGIAAMSDTMAPLMVTFMAGIVIVYVVLNPQASALERFIGWVTPIATNTTKTTTGSGTTKK